MFVHQIRTGGDRNFGYLFADDEQGVAAIVDPSFSPERIVNLARERGYAIAYVFHTHGHGDHTNGGAVVERLTGKRPLALGSVDPATGTLIGDGARLPLGDLAITILHTPGHTADSMCIHVGDAVFTGDTLFVGKVGGTDLGPGARAEYDSLHEKLLALPPETRVFPGHDYGVAPESTIAHERETNPFLLQSDLNAFVHLKRDWAAYKKEHGIA